EDHLEKKRNHIRQAAITVFARMGYYNSRVSDIAKEAQVAYGLFYHYFPSKDDVLMDIFQSAWTNLLKGLEHLDRSIEDPVEKVKAVVKFSLLEYEKNPDLLKVLVMDVPRLDKFYSEENQRLYNRYFNKVAQIITKGQEKGVINKESSPQVISYLTLGAVDALIRQYVYNPGIKKGQGKISKMTDQMVKVLINGIL
ncbi:MAG: TetR/AcrR family transcriptional regulator, partial [Spirochaetales bacterium]